MISRVHIGFVILFVDLVLIASSQQTPSVENGRIKKQDFYCSACKSMAESVSRQMNEVDPNERVQVGSYRVDGHGHQKLKEVPVGETAFHAENVVENLCSKFITDARETIPSKLRNIYEHACDDILEEHHDNLIDLLLAQNKNILRPRQLAEKFCVETSQFCKSDQLDGLFTPPPPPPPSTDENGEL